MSEQELANQLAEALSDGLWSDDGPDDQVCVLDWSSFEGSGVMSSNAGVTLRLSDGSEFQVTVVQSREA